MDVLRPLAVAGLFLGSSLVSYMFGTSFAIERPYHTAIIILLASAVSLWLFSCLCSCVLPQRRGRDYSAIPLEEHGAGLQNGNGNGSKPPENESRRSPRLLNLLLVALICARVELFREVSNDSPCAVGRSFEAWVAFFLICWRTHTPDLSWRRATSRSGPRLSAHQKVVSTIKSPNFGVFVLCLFSFALFNYTAKPRSSVICASAFYNRSVIPLMQVLETVFDFFIVVSCYHLLVGTRSRDAIFSVRGVSLLAWACLSSCFALIAIGSTSYLIKHRQRAWIKEVTKLYLADAAQTTVIVVLMAFCAILTIANYGVVTFSVVILLGSLLSNLTLAGLNQTTMYPNVDPATIIICLAVVLTFATVLCLRDPQQDEQRRKMSPFLKCFIAAAMVAVLAFESSVWVMRSGGPTMTHPIENLMKLAEEQQEAWRAQANSSNSLKEAAQNYRARYTHSPPPGFDLWYKFATDRHSIIIDDFDTIHEELLPFWSLEPAEIRKRVSDAIFNSWNAIGGIIIRNHKATIAPGTPGDHRWMLDGTIEMLKPFLEHLPDMNIPFNINDEPRVTIPYEDMQRYIAEGQKNSQRAADQTQYGDGPQGPPGRWRDPHPPPPTDTLFLPASFQRSFAKFVAPTCPPDSPARTSCHWDRGATCLACVFPHTSAPDHHFLANWTLAGDPCHQPDLADLHGLHLSPSAFRTTYDLVPVFSQGRAGGFADILYPSAWNYLRKTIYKPDDKFPDRPFSEKQATLFWRGATSEGFSHGSGAWTGMSRQRLVHLVNNSTSSAVVQVLLPRDPQSSVSPPSSSSFSSPLSKLTSSTSQSTYRSVTQPIHSIPHHLGVSTSLQFVPPIVRCDAGDCPAQAAQFFPSPPPPEAAVRVPFQQHWRYRYLADLDGAGYSGRFIPFLRSRSLPLKAGLMRSWWRGRITAWAHFVPLDMRFAELWSVLAYFEGWSINPRADGERRDGGRSKVGFNEGEGRRWLLRPHRESAEKIANAGREWAELTLRNEDMEIYMFRLLLEWARLTDDRRMMVGYMGDLSKGNGKGG